MWSMSFIKGNRTIWWIVFILSIFSSLVVYSSSIALAYRYKDGHSEYFLLKHIVITLMGLYLIFLIQKQNITIKHLNLISVLGFIISIPLLIFTLISGVRSGEATRWVEVPGLGITFQSSDLAKITLILFISRNLAFYQKKLVNLKSIFTIILFPTILVCSLILISNFSTAFLLFTTIFYLIFLSNISFQNILKILFVFTIIGSIFTLVIYFFPEVLPRGKTWKSRIENFFNEDTKVNYQAEQAKIAIANGALLGRGPGNSAQRSFLPQANSDFIYAILIEEYGTITGIIIAFFFLVIFLRSIEIAQKANNAFYSYVVAGLSFNLMLQAIVNMAVAVNLIPVTGQPLPFVSMGGTSLVFSCISIGIILNISRQIKEKQTTQKQDNIKTSDTSISTSTIG